MTKGQGSTVVQYLFHHMKTQETCIILKDEYRVHIKSFLKSCLLSSITNEEMQFIYTSSHRGKGNTQLVSNLYRMDYLCKNKTLQNRGQWVSLYFPNDPSMRQCQAMAPGHAVVGTNVWKKKPQITEICKEPLPPPIHTHSDT